MFENLIPRRRTRVLLGLSAMLTLQAAPVHALPYYVVASTCDATYPQDAAPSRSMGVGHGGLSPLLVSCALPHGVGAVASYDVHGWTAAGTSMGCSIRHIHKQTGALLWMKIFSLTGTQSVSVKVPSAFQSLNGVGELACTLPGQGRGRLHAIETFSFN